MLVDERDPGTQPRVLFYLEHAIQDASLLRSASAARSRKRMLYVEMDADGQRPPSALRALSGLPAAAPTTSPASMRSARPARSAPGSRATWSRRRWATPSPQVVPEHLERGARPPHCSWIDKDRAAVKDRLTKEIGYWDHRAEELKLQEQAGKPNARLNSQEARRRADDLQARLQKRMEELDLEAQVSALPPVVLGGLRGRACRARSPQMTGTAAARQRSR